MLNAHKSSYFINSFRLFHCAYEMTTMWLTVVDYFNAVFPSFLNILYNRSHF